MFIQIAVSRSSRIVLDKVRMRRRKKPTFVSELKQDAESLAIGFTNGVLVCAGE